MVKTVVAVALLASLGTVARADELASTDVPAAEPPAEQPPDQAVPVLAPPSSYQPIAQPVRQPVRDTDRESDETPPLSGGRLAGEFLLGGLFGFGGLIGGAYVGYSIETGGDGCSGEFCGFGGLILGGVAGMTLVAPVGVYLVGSADGQTGSLGATIGGSVLGLLGGIGAAAILQNEAGGVLFFAGPLVGSMVGFNLTRKYDGHKPRNWVPVANVSQGNTSFGVVGRF